MHAITEKMKWRTDLVLHVERGTAIKRLIGKLTKSLTRIGFFVVEFQIDRCGRKPFQVLANLFARFNISVPQSFNTYFYF